MLFKYLDLIVCTLAGQPSRFRILFTSRMPAAVTVPLIAGRWLKKVEQNQCLIVPLISGLYH